MTPVKSFPKPHREKLEGEDYEEFKHSIFERDGWKCRCCGERRNLTPHHLKKRSQLGGDTPGNVLTLCVICHEAVEKHEIEIEMIDAVVKFKIPEGRI